MPLCDTVLRLARAQIFNAYWSEMILAETNRTLVNSLGISSEKAAKRIEYLRNFEAFGDSLVTGFETLIPVMTNNQKDRHVLAAGVQGRVDQIVSQDKTGFPDKSVRPYGIEVVTPDQLLMNIWDLEYPHHRSVLKVLNEQSAALKAPPLAVSDILKKLVLTAPCFVSAVESALSIS